MHSRVAVPKFEMQLFGGTEDGVLKEVAFILENVYKIKEECIRSISMNIGMMQMLCLERLAVELIRTFVDFVIIISYSLALAELMKK